MIYMDHAATTMLLPKAAGSMRQYEVYEYANPSGQYPFAARAKAAIEGARAGLAKTIHAQPDEIYFTSGGSEADNWAIKTMAMSRRTALPHVITTRVEHSAVLNSCEYLEKRGYAVTYLNVDREGRVRLEELAAAFRKNTVLVSIMYANNEIGTIQPIREISRIAHERKVFLHVDGVQAYGHLPIDVKADGIDLLSVSAHKCNGPKGIGFLYAGREVLLDSYIHGGGQEGRKRAGTENVAAIVGFGVAGVTAWEQRARRWAKEQSLRDFLQRRLTEEVPDVTVQGGREKLANNLSCTIRGANAQAMVELLAMDGICISAGSACHSMDAAPSHVLKAIGLSDEDALSTIRITLGPENTLGECSYVARRIRIHAAQLRRK